MPALIPTEFSARITWLGQVPPEGDDIRSRAVESLEIGWGGPEGERHAGRTRPSCSRVTSQHKRGTEIANVRQMCLMSAEELAEIAERVKLDELDPQLAGATLVLEGIPDFSHLPPSSRLQGPDGVTLIIDMQNRPCNLPARMAAISMPGVILSQLEMQTMASAQWALTMYSTESAMISRLGSEYSMPS